MITIPLPTIPYQRSPSPIPLPMFVLPPIPLLTIPYPNFPHPFKQTFTAIHRKKSAASPYHFKQTLTAISRKLFSLKSLKRAKTLGKAQRSKKHFLTAFGRFHSFSERKFR